VEPEVPTTPAAVAAVAIEDDTVTTAEVEQVGTDHDLVVVDNNNLVLKEENPH
jgi:hypothetical protein